MVPQVASAKAVSAKTDTPQRAEQHIGHRSEPQPQLVGPHGLSRGTVSVEVELALLDPVLHVAARAVDVLVELPRARLAALERCDDEARIGLALASTPPWRRRGAPGSSS